MDLFLQAIYLAVTPIAICSIGFGALVGLVFGSIPGLTFTVALALALPITFSMDPVPAIGLLLGTYIGGMTGGSVSAILIGIPGTPSAAATVLDGHPMTKQGLASIALGTAVIVSVFGGIFSLIVMVVSVDLVSRLAIGFGPAEIFALVLFGMSTICGLVGNSVLKGLIAGVLGLIVMTIGIDALEGIPRMTFGSVNLLQGVNLLVALIGLFAVPFIIEAFSSEDPNQSRAKRLASVRAELPSQKLLFKNFGLMLRCSALGTGIGAIPGIGGPIAAFLAYDHAKRFSKNPEKFGKGNVEGVIAPETANNAVTGGTLIPLLSLGIPGDPATAIVLAGLMIHGIIPGPALFMNHANGEKHYVSKERTIYRSKGNTINAEKGMDLDMNKNLMKLLGKVEVLNSSGSKIDSYNLIVDQSNGGEVYKTHDSTHYHENMVRCSYSITTLRPFPLGNTIR